MRGQPWPELKLHGRPWGPAGEEGRGKGRGRRGWGGCRRGYHGEGLRALEALVAALFGLLVTDCCLRAVLFVRKKRRKERRKRKGRKRRKKKI
jgi:hypothetical protein